MRALKGEAGAAHPAPKSTQVAGQEDAGSLRVWVVAIGEAEGTLLMKCPSSSLAYATPVIQQTLLPHSEIAALVNEASEKGQFLWLILMGGKNHTHHFREQLTPVTDRRVLAEIDYMVKDMTLENIQNRLEEMGLF